MKSGSRSRGLSGYLPTLDGWRAIAILSVILSHDSLHSSGYATSRWFFENGGKGVEVFFAISGILITSRLLEEEHRFKHISLRRFYIRRAFRILPPALAYLAFLGVLQFAGKIVVYPGEWWGSLLFCRNYTRLLHLGASVPPAWFTAHFWSLSVEEHFYFLLPSILVFFRGRWRVIVLSSLTALVILNRGVQLSSRAYDSIIFHTDVRLDALLIPALFALALRSSGARARLTSFLVYWPFLVLATVLLVTSSLGPFWKTLLMATLMPCIITGSVLHPQNPFGRVLELRPLKYVGKISYSLYLWQMLFFTAHLYGRAPLGRLETWPYNYICTGVIAVLSYHCLERPMVRLGHRLAPSLPSEQTEVAAHPRNTELQAL